MKQTENKTTEQDNSSMFVWFPLYASLDDECYGREEEKNNNDNNACTNNYSTVIYTNK